MLKRYIFLAAIILVVVFGLLVFAFFPFFTGQFGNNIAVIPVKGELVSDAIGISQELSAMEIVDSIKDAEENTSVKAILLEINSPGGSVVASRQIVEKTRQAKKPVIAWISDLGASGAYYVASAADYIVADADSITGSVGVIAFFPNIEGLLEKIGVRVKILKRGENKAIGSPFESITPEQEKIVQQLLDEAFARFKQDLLLLRAEKLDREKFESIADGRIISGMQAKEMGLIDEIGTREQALEKAAGIAGIKDFEVLDYSKKDLSFLNLLTKFGYSIGTGAKKGFFSTNPAGINAKIQ